MANVGDMETTTALAEMYREDGRVATAKSIAEIEALGFEPDGLTEADLEQFKDELGVVYCTQCGGTEDVDGICAPCGWDR